MTVVDNIYSEFRDVARILSEAGQISLQIMLEANLRKTLLLGAASYFEMRLTREVQSFTDEVTSGNDLIGNLVKQKAISRQYHSWFDWKTNNANQFFSLFGSDFKQHMSVKILKTTQLQADIKAFMAIGHERNTLVHSDYASMYIDKTPEEIYNLYISAKRFVDIVGDELRFCSKSNILPIA